MFKYKFDITPESDREFSKEELEKYQDIFDAFAKIKPEDYHKGAILNPDFIKDYKERNIWFLNYIKKKKHFEIGWGGWDIKISKELSPLIESNYEYLTEEIKRHLLPITKDKDFIRRYGFDGYKPSFDFEEHSNTIMLWDFTDDLIDSYLEYKFGIKNLNNKEKDLNDEYYRVGNFEYKNHSLFVNDEKIKLSPQELLMMRKFMSDQLSGTKYYHYDDICDIVSTKGPTSKSNIQKLISKIRRAINKKTKDFIIESKSSDGYTFTMKNIR